MIVIKVRLGSFLWLIMILLFSLSCSDRPKTNQDPKIDSPGDTGMLIKSRGAVETMAETIYTTYWEENDCKRSLPLPIVKKEFRTDWAFSVDHSKGNATEYQSFRSAGIRATIIHSGCEQIWTDITMTKENLSVQPDDLIEMNIIVLEVLDILSNSLRPIHFYKYPGEVIARSMEQGSMLNVNEDINYNFQNREESFHIAKFNMSDSSFQITLNFTRNL